MGLIKDTQQNLAESVYQTIRAQLKKDGYTHVVLVNSFSKLANHNFALEDKYTTQIDTILTRMQQDGCTILDVKFNSLKGQGLTGNAEGYHTLITYTCK